ncbi:hypothetical protein J2T14_005188 [Paenibacillus harenae]|nr:hypothetical protein [Paenibacillus harenae]
MLPWFGIWTTLSSSIIWLVVWSLVNFVHLACYYYVYVQNTKKGRLPSGGTTPHVETWKSYSNKEFTQNSCFSSEK